MGNSQSGRTCGKQKITSRDKAILDLKVQRDRLKQYQKKIHAVLGRETEIARAQLAAGNKPLALLALKKKKYQEGLLESTLTQLLNLEQLVSSTWVANGGRLQVLSLLRWNSKCSKACSKETRYCLNYKRKCLLTKWKS